MAAAGFFVLMSAWALADPMLSGPDEPAQIVHAEALVRGQLVGTPVPPAHDPALPPHATGDPDVWVRVPGILKNVNQFVYWCFIFDVDRTPRCAPPLAGPSHDVRVVTYVARYPPLYYAVVGLPSLADPGPPGIIGMRLVSALLSAVLLAVALGLALRRSRIAALAVLVAATPTVVYYGASVNPNGLEMAAAVCFFTSVLALALPDRCPHTTAHIAAAAVSGCVLALARGLSPVWVGVALLTALCVADRTRLRDLARLRAARAAAAALAVAVVAAVAWIVRAHALLELSRPYPRKIGDLRILAAALDATPHYLLEMVGVFGANNVRPPLFATAATVTLFGLLVLAGLALGTWRERLALTGLLTAIVVVPLAADVLGGHRYGLGWQGRYTLPLGVGCPLVAGFVLARAASQRAPGRPALRAQAEALVLPGALLLGAGQFLSLWWDLRRFMVGAGGPLSAVFRHGSWQPPVPGALIMALALAGALTVSVSVLLAQRTRTPATYTESGSSP